MPYCPPRDQWDARPPADLGLHAGALAAAIEYHRSNESRWRRDFITASGRYIGVADEPPADGDVLGPVEPRGGPNGLVLRHGVHRRRVGRHRARRHDLQHRQELPRGARRASRSTAG